MQYKFPLEYLRSINPYSFRVFSAPCKTASFLFSPSGNASKSSSSENTTNLPTAASEHIFSSTAKQILSITINNGKISCFLYRSGVNQPAYKQQTA